MKKVISVLLGVALFTTLLVIPAAAYTCPTSNCGVVCDQVSCSGISNTQTYQCGTISACKPVDYFARYGYKCPRNHGTYYASSEHTHRFVHPVCEIYVYYC